MLLRERAVEYLAGAAMVRAAIAGLTRDQALARPIAGKWSTLEVVCHIADFEPIMADRMKRIIALDRPSLLGADENKFARALAYQDRDLEEEINVIESTRRQMACILQTLPDHAGDRVGIHNERGPKTLVELVTTATNHITHHVPFLMEKRKMLGLRN